ncbi:MAG TPA: helix-turn-helix transcriptional regulator [Candidatus Angelobacter sp.]|jgi:transcriptional regulator GlxA family with amidase domain|nr:helix-turn-helix transcriptional regulator [Candidatus Angelobacter sp.]
MRAKGRGTEPDGPFTSINQANQQFELIIQGTTPVIPPVREQRVRRVLQAIEGGRLRSVTDLAREVRLSPSHLQRLFKRETGFQISDLLAEARLRNAATLLLTTDMEVKEIAYLAGYQHHSSFVRAFQRRFGASPRCYRQASA